ncbi:MAG: amidohydrolase family protein [Acidobacteriota bacterium]|nr:amidohydrolase family protein [Acidobacteriota bacterium]
MMKAMGLAAATSLIAIAQTTSSAPVTLSKSGSFLLRGGTIHTISGPVIENGSVLVRDGKIIGVGRNLPAPEGAQVIDITGEQVYPGMIDSASRIGLEKSTGEGVSDADEIGLFNPQLNPADVVNPADDFIPATRANGVTSTIEMPEGDLISGQMTLIHMDGWTNDSMIVAPKLAVHLNFPAIETTPIPPHEVDDDDDEPTTAVDRPPVPYPVAKKAYDAKMRELNEFFASARRYMKAQPLKPDRRFEAMIPILEGREPMFVTAVREREIRDAIAFADRQKIRIVLADPYEAYKVLPLIKSHNIPVVLGPTYTLPLNEDDPYDRSYTTPGELYKAGVKFSIATFSAKSTRNLPYQAAAAAPFGLPKDEAYKAVSLNAAEIFGLGKVLGSIDEGKVADLIVTDGDPLETMTHVKMVFIGGKQANLKTRQQMLYEKYMARPDKD